MPICDFCNVEVPAVKLKNHNTSWFHQRAVKIFQWNGIPSVSDNHCAFCDKGFSSPSRLSQHSQSDKNHKLLYDAFQRSIQNQQHARAPSPPVRAPLTLSSDPKGLRNKGNTCFAAVAWQALKNVLPYTNLGWEIVQHLGSESVAHTLLKLSDRSEVDIRHLIRAVNGTGDLFPEGAMGDPGELVAMLVDKLSGELQLQDPLQTRQVLSSTHTCSYCGTQVKKTDHQHGITLPVRQGTRTTLQELLHEFVAVEILDEKNRSRCEGCDLDGIHDVAMDGSRIGTVNKKQLSVESWPDHLFVWLKRLHHTGFITTQVDVPDVLQCQGKEYHLQVVHYHNGVNHYICEVLSSNRWFTLNDEVCAMGRLRNSSYGAWHCVGALYFLRPPPEDHPPQPQPPRLPPPSSASCDLCGITLTTHQAFANHCKSASHKALAKSRGDDLLAKKRQTDIRSFFKPIGQAPENNLRPEAEVRRDSEGRHEDLEESRARKKLPQSKGSDFEHNLGDAVKAFYSTSPTEERISPVSTVTKQRCLEAFRTKMNNALPMFKCAVCGIFQFCEKKVLPLEGTALEVLRVRAPRVGIKLANVNGVDVHLEPSGLCDGGFVSCPGCAESLKKGEVPSKSFLLLDFGCPPLELPELSVCERVFIAKVVVHVTVIKVAIKASAYVASCTHRGGFKGHVISFRAEQQGLMFVQRFLDPEEAATRVSVVLLGNRIGDAGKNLAFERLGKCFDVRPTVILQWLHWLKQHNSSYADVDVDPLTVKQRSSEFLRRVYVDTTIPDTATAVEGIVAEEFRSSDVTALDRDVSEDLRQVLITDHSSSRDVTSDIAGALRKIIANKSNDQPLNEYEELDKILLGGFPWLFVSWPPLLVRKNLTNGQITTLFSRCDALSQDAPLLFFFYDLKVRRELARRTAVVVKAKKGCLEKVSHLLGAEDLPAKLDRVLRDPKGREAKVLEAQVLGYISTVTKDISFSPGKRKACLGPLYSMYRKFGLPSFWVTFSPIQNDNVLGLRIILGDGDAVSFALPDLTTRAKLIQKNPAVTARLFDLAVRAVCETLFGICEVSKVSKTVLDYPEGIFGFPRAFFSVVECQKRGALHWHGVLWTHLSPHIVSSMLHDTEANLRLGEILDTILCARVDQSAKAALLDKSRAQYRGPTHEVPEEVESPEFRRHVQCVVVDCNCHLKHDATCFKGQKGSDDDKKCRFGMRCLVHSKPTRFYTVKPNDKGGYECHELIEPLPPAPDQRIFPVGVGDDRPLLFLQRTEQDPTSSKIGSIVVSFNEVLTACLRCNTCVNFIGSAGAARSIMFYLIKYVTKDTHPLSGVLPVLKAARLEATSKPSTKGNHLPAGNTTGHHTLVKLCNKIHRKMEISSEMAAAVLIDTPSEYFSHTPSFLSVQRAIKDVLERLGGDDSDETESENEDEVAHIQSFVEPETNQKIIELVAEKHVHYRYRGEKLMALDLYTYEGIVSVLTRAEAKDPSSGRVPNLYFEFSSSHPNFATHIQRLKSKQTVPNICGTVPILPSWDMNKEEYLSPDTMTGALKRKATVFAKFMVTLFSPWDERGIPEHSMSWGGFLELMAQTKKEFPNKFFVLENFCSPLRGSTNNQIAVNCMRRSCADSLKEARLCKSLSEEYDFAEQMVESELERQIETSYFDTDENAAVAHDFAENVCAEYALLTDANASYHQTDCANAAESERVAESSFGAKNVQKWRKTYEDLLESEKQLKRNFPEDALNEVGDINFAHGNSKSTSSNDCITFSGRDFTTCDGKRRSLNDEQMRAVQCLQQMLNSELPDKNKRVLFLLGGAGTGKSAVIRYLSERLGSLANIVAPTGIAATVIGSTTIHAALGFSIDNVSAKNLPDLKDDELRALARIWAEKRLIIIDEISMVSREFLDAIDHRLQAILGTKQYMGGLVLLAVGDFYQIPPTAGTPLYKLSSSGNSLIQNVFEKAYLLELHVQQRSPDDALHCRILKLLRTNPKEGMKLLLENLKLLGRDDARFCEAPIIVCSNIERYHLNVFAAKRFAEKRGLPVFAWTSSKTVTSVEDNPAEYTLFVSGSPAFVNENLSPFSHKIANGTPVRMKSLVFEKAMEVERVHNGITYLRVPPKFVLVEKEDGSMTFPVSKKRFQKVTCQGQYQVELAFSRTFHKVQGVTIAQGVVLDLKKRPKEAQGKLFRLSLEGVYVALSRVTRLDDLRVLPWGLAGHNHLLRLAKKKKFPGLSAATLLGTELTYTW